MDFGGYWFAVKTNGKTETMLVYPIGTTVEIHAGKDRIPGFIDQICIANVATYQVVYWNNSERKTVWLPEGEFGVVPSEHTKMRIGFASLEKSFR